MLTVTQMLRKHGVVGKFVEFWGDGLAQLPLADRATIANMAPEYGATCGFFPADEVTLSYMRLTGRSDDEIALVETYCKEQGLWRHEGTSRALPRAGAGSGGCADQPGRAETSAGQSGAGAGTGAFQAAVDLELNKSPGGESPCFSAWRRFYP